MRDILRTLLLAFLTLLPSLAAGLAEAQTTTSIASLPQVSSAQATDLVLVYRPGVVPVSTGNPLGYGLLLLAGPAGKADVAAVSGRFRGAYAAGASYQANDLATQGGTLYAAIAAIPSAGSFDSTKWAAVSAGATGGGSGAPCAAIGTTTGSCADGGVLAGLQSVIAANTTAAQAAGQAAAAAQTTANAALPAAQKGAANGVAGLDAGAQVPAGQLGNVVAALTNRTPIAPSNTVLGPTAVAVFPPPPTGGYAHLEIPLPLSAPAGTTETCTFDGTPPATSGTAQTIGVGQAFRYPDNLGRTPTVSPLCLTSVANVTLVDTPNLPFGAN